MRRTHGIWLVVALLSATHVSAAESRPAISKGATRDQVIAAFGVPTGGSKFGKVEILNYRNGQVRLENGRVERLSMKAPPPPAEPPAATPTPTPASGAAAGATEPKNPLADVWMTSFDDASRDAVRRDSAILALFTSSDASPTSRQFQKEIALHPEFVNAFRARYVLLQIDFPVRTELPAEVRERNEMLRDRYGVQAIPALLILSATGEKLAAIAIADSVPGSAFRGRLIPAVLAAYELPTVSAAPQPVAPKEEPPAPAPTPAPEKIHVAPAEVTNGLTSARWLIMAALGVGTLIAGTMMFVLWLVLRKMNKPVAVTRQSSMASRISHAASGLPTHAEITAWSKEILCRVVARLAETDGFVAEDQPKGSDKDLVLKRPGDPTPEVIVCCVTGNAGVIPTRKVREIVGLTAAENVREGWFISPMGFSLDARAYAEQNNIRLIDGSGLLERLSDLPSFALPKVLASAAK